MLKMCNWIIINHVGYHVKQLFILSEMSGASLVLDVNTVVTVTEMMYTILFCVCVCKAYWPCN